MSTAALAALGDSIPVVDFDGVFSCSDLSACPQVQQLHEAFTQVGFVFIKNHGIDKKLILDVFSLAMEFFKLPLEVKKALEMKKQQFQHVGDGSKHTGNNGYVSMEQESVDPSIPGDLKECLQVSSMECETFPDEELPLFKPTLLTLYKAGISFSRVLLELMGHALQLKDPQFFVKAHSKSGYPDNFTTCRVLHYPPLPPTRILKPGQLRCGEHVDYGSLTLLFQDPMGGLQVKKSGGGYIDVPYVPDAVLVNLGAQMQMWTADIYMATPHRVLVPEEDSERRNCSRQSLVIFMHTDHETVLESVDGSGKYPSVTAYEDTQRRLLGSYNY